MDNKRDEVRYISQFEHENAVMHYGKVNHRSMIMLICSCVTILLIVAIFVVGYTIRERDIMKLLTQVYPTASEVAGDGVHQQPNP